MTVSEMDTNDLYERYFGNCDIKEQANLFTGSQELEDYIKETEIAQYGFPVDDVVDGIPLANIAAKLWDKMSQYREEN